MSLTPELIAEQIAYYRARAGEYDEWFYRLGRYDYGAEVNQHWFDEAAAVIAAMRRVGPVARILELACGTGNWTRELAKLGEVTALDASPEMLALNAAKVAAANVHYRRQDLFAWEPEGQYDLVFFGFWLSHVPPELLTPFLAKVRDAVRPGGTLFLVDSRYEPTSGAQNHQLPSVQGTVHTRSLNDGREFAIVKVFYDPAAVCAALMPLGFNAAAHVTERYFYYVTATRVSDWGTSTS